ncbi:NUDIX domain-containing protein [Longispora sp. NPDC051575]|uniref:NUDIX domain-containing protein n=1 Tax=Longispora sp. NPDC051575 TaxID=3154943 RepID=UPI00341446DA
MTLRQERRIAAYGVCRDDAGRVLLVQSSPTSGSSGSWNLPGGGLDHGEDPAVAVAREFLEETGLVVKVTGLHSVSIEVNDVPHLGIRRHQDQIMYDVRVVGGHLTPEVDGSSHRVEWLSEAQIEGLPLFDRVRTTLGVTGLPELRNPNPPVSTPEEPDPDRGQRFSAYGVVTDPAGRILLTLISENYPGAGTWHLPGGGTDFGEDSADGVLRELREETGQTGRITQLLTVSNMHNPAAWGPEGRAMDWHGVRVTYRVIIDTPTDPVVGEVNGSTAAAGWFTAAEAATLRLNRPTFEALTRARLLS